MLFKDHYQTQLNNKIVNCKECELKDNPGPVLGYGSQDASVMFIGDVAKLGDLKFCIPFTGIAKERMTQAIKDSDLSKGQYYLTYLIKHVITDKSKPDLMGNKGCLKILLEEIELINPRIICSMGYYVTKALMNEYKMNDAGKSMKALHGNGYVIPAQTYYKGRYKKRGDNRPKRYLIPTWSPAVENVIMNADFKTDVMTIKSVQSLGVLLFDS